MTERNILMKTFKQYISESGVWDQGTGRGFLAPWKPLPDSGGRNKVPAGSIPSPKRPVPTSLPRGPIIYGDGFGNPRVWEDPAKTWPPTPPEKLWPPDSFITKPTP